MISKQAFVGIFGSICLSISATACRFSQGSSGIPLKEGADYEDLFAARACEDKPIPDYALARAFYLKAANSGQPYADYKLAEFYHLGIGTRKDEAKAIAFYTKAFKDRIGCIAPLPLVPENLESEPIERLLKRAKDGDSTAQYYLGVCHQNGLLKFRKSLPAAKIYYQSAMDTGSSEAAYNLGSIYLNPQDRDYDVEKAFKCFVCAAVRGCKPAILIVSKLDNEVYKSILSAQPR